jgi:ABC-type phosphate transport system substrate-binding protein
MKGKRMKGKRMFSGVALLLAMATSTASAQPLSIGIKDAQFTQPLLEKLSEEYQKVDPSFQVTFTDKDDADGTIVVSDNGNGASFGRFVLLPIAHSGSTLLEGRKLRKGLDYSTFHDIFFGNKDEIIEEDFRKKYPLNIYSLMGPSVSSQLLADYLKSDVSEIKGKKILGKEKNLVQVVKARQDAFSVSLPAYVYDKETGSVNTDITVVPVDLNQDGKISDEERSVISSLDKISNYLDNVTNIGLPTGDLSLQTSQPELQRFVQWITGEGQNYLHEYGFLRAPTTLTALK